MFDSLQQEGAKTSVRGTRWLWKARDRSVKSMECSIYLISNVTYTRRIMDGCYCLDIIVNNQLYCLFPKTDVQYRRGIDVCSDSELAITNFEMLIATQLAVENTAEPFHDAFKTPCKYVTHTVIITYVCMFIKCVRLTHCRYGGHSSACGGVRLEL